MIEPKKKLKSHNRPVPPHSAGLTMIEVLLALAIFSVGLLAVAGMQLSSVTKNSSSRMNMMAVEYAADYMERLLDLGTNVDLSRNGIDEDGDTVTDEDNEILGWPQLAIGTVHAPEDFLAVDYDQDGVVDIVPHPEFGQFFDLTWATADYDSEHDDLIGGTAGQSGQTKLITMTVSWANGDKSLFFTCLKSMAL